MKAIETIYNGYRFRSRSEARWAVFFDALGIKYQYEPEGYTFPDSTMYLPDFYLPNSNTFFEVKGVMSNRDMTKINNLIKHSGKNVAIGYPDMSFQATSLYLMDANGNDCMDYNLDYKDCSWLIKCNNCHEYQFIGSLGSWQCRGCGHYDGDTGYSFCCPGDWTEQSFQKPSEVELDAFEKAKQARFEQGACG